MPSYKLCYFKARGLAEVSRLLFAEAGVQYEDVRYEREDWPAQKPKMLFGTMPVLFVDGEQIAHSRAAFRYLARKFKLDGGDDVTAAKIDMWVEVFIESLMKMPFSEQDKKVKEEKSKEVMKDVILPKLQKLDELIGSCDGPFVFGKLTALDIFMFGMLDNMIAFQKSDAFLDGVPKVKALVKAVGEREKIAAWIKKRPVTEN